MAWKPLGLSASAAAHLPPLLISSTFTSGSYDVHLTDLTHIWSESLNLKDIVQRSREESTSIDPRYADQRRILMEKIQAGLAGEKDTAVALTINTGADRPSLSLELTVQLPKGLSALEWPIRLSAAPQTTLTSQLTLPLLQTQHQHMQEIGSLLETLKVKDHVIQKLLDTLEGQGTNLGQVFPQAAGKVGRNVDRKKAAERVKGLSSFDKDAWQKGLDHEASTDVAQLIRDSFPKDGGQGTRMEANLEVLEEQDKWWDSIKGITINLDSGKISTIGSVQVKKSTNQAKPTRTASKEDSDEGSDGFQVQANPPRLHKTSDHPMKAANDSTSDDDDDLDAPSQVSRIPDSFPVSPPRAASPLTRKNPFTLGGKKTASKKAPAPTNRNSSTEAEDDAPPSRKVTPKKKAGPKTASPEISRKHDESTADEDEGPLSRKSPLKEKTEFKATSSSANEGTSTEDEASSPHKTSPKKRAATKPASPSMDDNQSTADESSAAKVISPNKKAPSSIPSRPAAKPKKILGKIGEKKKAATPEPQSEPEITPPPKVASPAPMPPVPPTQKKSKFTIGGKKKQAELTPVPETSPSLAEASSAVTTPNEKEGQARHIHSPLKETSVKAKEESQSRGRVAIRKKEETLEVRETSLERASRKRQELKRELEEKSKAPVKKKRKF